MSSKTSVPTSQDPPGLASMILAGLRKNQFDAPPSIRGSASSRTFSRSALLSSSAKIGNATPTSVQSMNGSLRPSLVLGTRQTDVDLWPSTISSNSVNITPAPALDSLSSALDCQQQWVSWTSSTNSIRSPYLTTFEWAMDGASGRRFVYGTAAVYTTINDFVHASGNITITATSDYMTEYGVVSGTDTRIVVPDSLQLASIPPTPTCTIPPAICKGLWESYEPAKGISTELASFVLQQADAYFQSDDVPRCRQISTGCSIPTSLDGCFVSGTNVQVFYWPDGARTAMVADIGRSSTLPVTQIVGDVTMTSPSVYLSFDQLAAFSTTSMISWCWDTSGWEDWYSFATTTQLGPTYSNALFSLRPEDVSTLEVALDQISSAQTVDLDNISSSTDLSGFGIYAIATGPQSLYSSVMKALAYDAEFHPQLVTRQLTISDLYRPGPRAYYLGPAWWESVAMDDYHWGCNPDAPYTLCNTIYDDLYRAQIAIPLTIRELNPSWARCIGYISGARDPPVALTATGAAAGITTSHSSSTSAAQPAGIWSAPTAFVTVAEITPFAAPDEAFSTFSGIHQISLVSFDHSTQTSTLMSDGLVYQVLAAPTGSDTNTRPTDVVYSTSRTSTETIHPSISVALDVLRQTAAPADTHPLQDAPAWSVVQQDLGSPVIVVGTHILQQGAATIISNTTYSLIPGGSGVVVYGHTQLLDSAESVTPGREHSPIDTDIADDTSARTMASIRSHVTDSASALVISSTTYAGDSGDSNLYVKSKGTAISDATPAAYQDVQGLFDDDSRITAMVIGTQILQTGSDMVVSGTTYSLDAVRSALFVNGMATSITQIGPATHQELLSDGLGHVTAFVLGTQIVIPAANAEVVSGTTYSMAPGGSLLYVNGQASVLTVQQIVASSTRPLFTINVTATTTAVMTVTPIAAVEATVGGTRRSSTTTPSLVLMLVALSILSIL